MRDLKKRYINRFGFLQVELTTDIRQPYRVFEQLRYLAAHTPGTGPSSFSLTGHASHAMRRTDSGSLWRSASARPDLWCDYD